MALRQSGRVKKVIGWDINPAATKAALQLGAIDHAVHSIEAAAVSDLIIFATPVDVTLSLLSQIANKISPTVALTDTGSSKNRIVNGAEQIIPGRFVGGHPMAGSERSGVAASRSTLFHKANWLITPLPNAQPDCVIAVQSLAEICGAIPRFCDPQTHDELVAALSHLPHLLAWELSSVAELKVKPEWRDAAAGSFKDGARVARSNPAHWAKILMDNRRALLASLDAADQWRTDARLALEQNDLNSLTALLESAGASISKFPG